MAAGIRLSRGCPAAGHLADRAAGAHGARAGGRQCGPGNDQPARQLTLRRQGASAEYVCPRRDDKPLDTVHDLLGVEYFTSKPVLEAARPAAIADGGVVEIG